MSLCKKCGRMLFHQYGDGPNVCAACQENHRLGLPAVVEARPGEPWQPVQGSVGGVGFGSGRRLTPWWDRPIAEETTKPVAPWPDFNGAAIREGDLLRHPTGEQGRVVLLAATDPRVDRKSQGDGWRVDYGDGPLSRLNLQIGGKGRAIVVEAGGEPHGEAPTLAREGGEE